MSRNLKDLFCLLLALCLISTVGMSAFAQGKDKLPKPPKEKPVPPIPGEGTPGFFDNDGVTSEKSMIVDGNVAIKLCVSQGDLKINGWHRDEVRVFVKDGRKFRLKPLEKSAGGGKVNWLWIGNIVEGRPSPSAECVAGDSIEIDAPIGSTFDITGNVSRITADSVKAIKVELNAGMISLRNITGGITAYTGRGGVMVENSAGAIALGSTTGNIIAIEVSPGQIGDLLRAKTQGGAITMQKVAHRQIEASSISGSLLFDGKFLSGGIYKFRTSNGSIKLAIPALSSCTLTTTYGEGSFNSEIPLKILTENITPRAKIVVSKIGSGDATVNLTTSNGSIGIKKQVTP